MLRGQVSTRFLTVASLSGGLPPSTEPMYDILFCLMGFMEIKLINSVMDCVELLVYFSTCSLFVSVYYSENSATDVAQMMKCLTGGLKWLSL